MTGEVYTNKYSLTFYQTDLDRRVNEYSGFVASIPKTISDIYVLSNDSGKLLMDFITYFNYTPYAPILRVRYKYKEYDDPLWCEATSEHPVIEMYKPDHKPVGMYACIFAKNGQKMGQYTCIFNKEEQ